jgi:hypothetical protein
MKSEKTVKVRMLGNAFELENNQVYDLDLERAASLSGLGYAVIVEEAAEPAKEEDHAI